MTDKRVLTIQDISCLGQCSITAALPIISACGVETVILPSAVLSTHTGGFKGYTFRDLTEDIPGIMKHWMSEGIKFDCLYTGYLGSIAQMEYVRELKRNVINEDGPLIVDPAMADGGKLYSGFDRSFVKGMAGLCAEADIILPNMTEAAFMTGSELMVDNQDESYVKELLNKLSSLGPKKIVLKGISFEEDKIGVAVYDCITKKLSYYFTNKISEGSPGTGDCYAAALTGALMQGRSLEEAASIAADFVVECILATYEDKTHKYGVKFEKALPMLVRTLNN